MFHRIYIHNYRCLENFEMNVKGVSSALLIGENGAGKSAIARVLEILQRIGRGTNRVGQLVEPRDFSHGRSDVPIRFVFDISIKDKLYTYEIALELPERFRELRVSDEKLTVEGSIVYSRKEAQLTLHSSREARFNLDWHLIALTIIQEQSESDPLHDFKDWLSRMLILKPIPDEMTGESREETLESEITGRNFGDWLTGLLRLSPASYTTIDKYLKEVMPDFHDFKNEPVGKDASALKVRFQDEESGAKSRARTTIAFQDLSDGEKCLFLCALVLAANEHNGPLFCFWDEPDNYLSLPEVGHFVMSLRRSFETEIGGQLLITSHNPEAIRRFSDHNTLLLARKSRLEPTVLRKLADTQYLGKDKIEALISRDMEI